MSFKKSRLDDFFQNSRDALTNAQNNLQLRTLLTNQNVDDARFQEGFTLLDSAARLQLYQKEKHLEKRNIYRQLQKLLAETHEGYAKHVKFVKLSCRNDLGKLLSLGVEGVIVPKKDLNGWLSQTNFFYGHAIADTDLHPFLLRNGITLTELQDTERKVADVEQTNQTYREKVGEAQSSIEERNRAIDDFKFWLSEFIAVCRTATVGQPQLLEALKILVYSKGYKKKTKEEPETTPDESLTAPPTTQPETEKTRKTAAKGT